MVECPFWEKHIDQHEVCPQIASVEDFLYTGDSKQINYVTGVALSADGTKLYIADDIFSNVLVYVMSTAWDITTASYSYTFSTGLFLSAFNIEFKPDGTKFYIQYSYTIYQYNLSVAWDLTTTSYIGSYNASTQDNSGVGVHFKSDGTMMFLMGTQNDRIYAYLMSTPWALSSMSYSGDQSDLFTSGVALDISFSNDGTKLFIADKGYDTIIQIDLTTAWDITTGVDNGYALDISLQSSNVFGIHFSPSEDELYIADSSSRYIYRYSK